jgi:acyl-CoA reductase-like NAD-dependent aldehyde dehydrogenase
MVDSVSANGGRSCLNASAIVVPKYAAEIADALAQRLGPIQPARADDPNARLSGFANPRMAEFIDSAIEEGLKTPGAVDVTAKYQSATVPAAASATHWSRGEFTSSSSTESAAAGTAARRMVVFDGGTYLRPTIVRCDSFAHPLANREFLFPYASIVEVPQRDMLKQIGPSLVVTAITKDAAWTEELLTFPHIQRLNLGPISTMKISWDQPHEGNMFEFLWKRRAFETA